MFFKDILTVTETESRLSLGMTLNKTYHIQTTVNHHRFKKVWTSIADLPTSKIVVQTFFLEKVWLRNTLPIYDLGICPIFFYFFYLSPNGEKGGGGNNVSLLRGNKKNWEFEIFRENREYMIYKNRRNNGRCAKK